MVDKSRAQRIADQIRREIGRLLITEVKDPRLHFVSLTECEVARDLSHAKLFYVLADPKVKRQAVEQSLEKASGFFRSRLAQELELRKTPKLRFIYDESVERGRYMSHLIDEVIAHDEAVSNTDKEA